MRHTEKFKKAFEVIANNKDPKFAKYSFYAMLMGSFKVVPTKSTPTASIYFSESHRNYVLQYNPEYFDKLSVKECIAVLVHECHHAILRHVFRGKDYENHKLFNIAADISFNNFIDDLPKEALYPSTFGFPDEKDAETYYDFLKDLKDRQQKWKEIYQNESEEDDSCSGSCSAGTQNNSENGDEDSQSGSGNGNGASSQNDTGNGEGSQNDSGDENGSGSQIGPDYDEELGENPFKGKPDLTKENTDAFDDHNQWSETSEEYEELARSIMEKAIEKAVEKSRGNVPANISSILELWRKKAKVSWKRALKNIVGKRKGDKDKTIKRKHRRFPHRNELKGKQYLYNKPNIVVFVDTSGSMSNEEIVNGLIEIKEVAKQTKSNLTILQVDTEIKVIENFNPNKSVFERIGYGGTYMGVVPKYIKEKNMDVDVLIGISDMYIENVSTDTNWGDFNKPVIWLSTQNITEKMIDLPKTHKLYNISDV